jgi:hypothetical protein
MKLMLGQMLKLLVEAWTKAKIVGGDGNTSEDKPTRRPNQRLVARERHLVIQSCQCSRAKRCDVGRECVKPEVVEMIGSESATMAEWKLCDQMKDSSMMRMMMMKMKLMSFA